MLYIHQYPDWTHFRLDYKRVIDALGKTCLAEGELICTMNICGLKDEELTLVVNDIVANAAIDGIELNPDIVREEVKLRTQGNRNHIKNFLWAFGNTQDPLTIEKLINLHKDIDPFKATSFRTDDSEITYESGNTKLTFKGPDPERLHTEIANFLTWFEIAPMDGVIKAALAHFWFITLRPFKNGNGRMARLLATLQLARTEHSHNYEYALIRQIFENREEYFKILNKAQSGNGDLTEWVLWFLSQMQAAIQKSKEMFDPSIRAVKFTTRHDGITFTDREQKILMAHLHGQIPDEFKSSHIAGVLGVSHDTALREIQSLINKKILKATTKRGRSQSYSLV